MSFPYFDDEDERPARDVTSSVTPPEILSDGVTVTLPSNVLDNIVNWAAIEVERQLQARADKMVRARVDQVVSETFDRAVAMVAETAIQDFLTKPRQQTNSWGEVMPGPTTTMADLIPAKVKSWLEEKVNARDGSRADIYGRNEAPTRFEHILNKHVRDELTAETKAAASKVTEEAKKVVQASVGRFIADQLVPQIDATRRA